MPNISKQSGNREAAALAFATMLSEQLLKQQNPMQEQMPETAPGEEETPKGEEMPEEMPMEDETLDLEEEEPKKDDHMKEMESKMEKMMDEKMTKMEERMDKMMVEMMSKMSEKKSE